VTHKQCGDFLTFKCLFFLSASTFVHSGLELDFGLPSHLSTKMFPRRSAFEISCRLLNLNQGIFGHTGVYGTKVISREHHILVLSSAYNGLTQRIHTKLVEQNHDVKVRLSISPENIDKQVKKIQPDFVICPFLKEKIPEKTWREKLCLVFHPGIPGDGGAHSLDWAVMNQEKRWGGILLAANNELDGGDIWAAGFFTVPQDASKADIYRGLLGKVAVDCVDTFLEKYDKLINGEPLSQLVNSVEDFETQGRWRNPLSQKDRKINWDIDTTEQILRKIRSSDSAPGVFDTFLNQKVFLYGAHAESTLKGHPFEIICTRNGAICVGTTDGAIWISHMRMKKNSQFPFKLPATKILGKQLEELRIPEIPFEPFDNIEYIGSTTGKIANKTYRDIWYEQFGEIGILNFNFYNGAMSEDHCHRLMKAYVEAKKLPTKVLILAGRGTFFSNGIHLNMIESCGDESFNESWKNIDAINGVVKEILTCRDKITVSAVEGNAGAGGVYLAAASDLVWMGELSILNPHYKTMGLYGSEYHTYTLKRRVGVNRGQNVLSKCMPVNATAAIRLGLADQILPWGNFEKEMIAKASKLSENYSETIKNKIQTWNKLRHEAAIMAENNGEMQNMYSNFQNDLYNEARKKFVLKSALTETPHHLIEFGPGDIFKSFEGNCKLIRATQSLDILHDLQCIIDEIKQVHLSFQPKLEVLQVGNLSPSNIHINQIQSAAHQIGLDVNITHFSTRVTEKEVMEKISDFNADRSVDGIMLQLPLDSTEIKDPKQVIDFIHPVKDVEGIGNINIGRIISGDRSGFVTCAPAAIFDLIKSTGCMIQGSNAVIVGRSRLVGSPTASLLNLANATTTVCHEHTRDLQTIVEAADILVVAVGIHGIIQGEWIKQGAVVIDCGINTVPDSTKKLGHRIVGDVDFSPDTLKASFITPVPGGVGPMSVAKLMTNSVKAAIKNLELSEEITTSNLEKEVIHWDISSLNNPDKEQCGIVISDIY